MNNEELLKFHDLHINHGYSLRKLEKNYNIDRHKLSKQFKQFGLKIRMRKYTFNENYFEEISSPNQNYIFGFLISDGYIFKHSKRTLGMRLKVQKRDIAILHALKKEMSANNPIKSEFKNNKEYVYLEFHSKKLFEDLVKINLIPNKTFLIKYPHEKVTNHAAFILGCLDGDGHPPSVSHDGKRKTKSLNFTGTYDLLDGIREIIFKELKIKKPILKKKKNTYSLNYYSKEEIYIISNWLYSSRSSIYLKRKLDSINNFLTADIYGKKIVYYKCPNCGAHDYFEKRHINSLKKYTFKAKFCSLSCSGSFYRKYQLNDYVLTPEMEKNLNNNIVTYGVKKIPSRFIKITPNTI